MKQGPGPKDPKAEGDTVAGAAEGAGMAEVAADTEAARAGEGRARTTVAIAAGKDAVNKSRGIDIHYKRRKAEKANRL
jgi:hypothetical protein